MLLIEIMTNCCENLFDNLLVEILNVYSSFKLSHASRHCFGPDSEFFRQLLFFFNAKDSDDFTILMETCRLLLQNVQDSGISIIIKFLQWTPYKLV